MSQHGHCPCWHGHLSLVSSASLAKLIRKYWVHAHEGVGVSMWVSSCTHGIFRPICDTPVMHYGSHYADEEMEAQRGQVTSLTSHSWHAAEPGQKVNLSN